MSTLDTRTAAVVREAAATVPAFAARLAEAGVSPGEVQRVSDLDALPVLTKDDVLAEQRASPPFGGLLAPGAEVRRVFQSPGPIYEPQLAGADPWRWRAALDALGVSETDVVLNCFGYHLTPAGAMFEEAALALGATVLPGGIGNLDLQAQGIHDLRVSAYTGLPSYLKSLLDRYDDAGFDRANWRVDKALVTGEPLPDDLREALTERVPMVRMAYGTAEAGLLGYETEPGGGLVVPDEVLVQICDLDTGLPVEHGPGQVVVTLFRPDYPLVRFGTGDLSEWIEGPDGSRRLAGVLGRVGAAVKVRGMFLHPKQVESTMHDVPGVAAYRFVVERVDHRDELHCEIVPQQGTSADKVASAVADRVRSGLRFAAEVRVTSDIEGADTLVDRRTWD